MMRMWKSNVLKLAGEYGQLAICVLAALLFFFVYVHSPVALRTENIHDDALFIRLGANIANGDWLGPYSQFTLAKGSGYPLFLALNAWLGTSITISQTLFFLVSVVSLYFCVHRIFGFRTVVAVAFVIAVCSPIFFFSRILRDAIYASQTLLILSLALSITFIDKPGILRLWKSVFLGVLLAWFFLTREEGIWIMPAVIILVASGLWYVRERRRMLSLIASYLMVAAICVVVQQSYKLINKHYYGYAVGVDVKDKNFVDALNALQSVRAGKFTPMVPVSRDVRVAVRSVSPRFASISDYFDPPTGTPWQFGCKFYPNTCGDIAGGWFMWALRDAAASKGHYDSPKEASMFFGAMAREISESCAAGKLKCAKNWVPYMPEISRSQLDAIPASMREGIDKLLFVDASPGLMPSAGDSDTILLAARFLGFPPYTPTEEQTATRSYVIRGWFMSPAGDWLHVETGSSEGRIRRVDVTRNASPDLVAGFGQPSAGKSRFELSIECIEQCPIAVVADDGANTTLNLAQRVGSRFQIKLGGGVLNFDEIRSIPKLADYDKRELISILILEKLRSFYSKLMRSLLFFGLFSFVASIVIRLFADRGSVVGPKISIPAMIWVLILTRLSLLALIDVSAFPAMNIAYLAPLFSLLILGIATSCMSLIDAVLIWSRSVSKLEASGET